MIQKCSVEFLIFHTIVYNFYRKVLRTSQVVYTFSDKILVKATWHLIVQNQWDFFFCKQVISITGKILWSVTFVTFHANLVSRLLFKIWSHFEHVIFRFYSGEKVWYFIVPRILYLPHRWSTSHDCKNHAEYKDSISLGGKMTSTFHK